MLGLTAGPVFFLVPDSTQTSWLSLSILGDWFGFPSGFVTYFCLECYSTMSFLICPTDFHWGAPWLLDALVPSSPAAPWCSYYFGLHFTAIWWTHLLGSGKRDTCLETVLMNFKVSCFVSLWGSLCFIEYIIITHLRWCK